MTGETVKFNHNWRNLKKRASSPRNIQDQASVNKELLNYIRILQEQIDDIRATIDDDGR